MLAFEALQGAFCAMTTRAAIAFGCVIVAVWSGKDRAQALRLSVTATAHAMRSGALALIAPAVHPASRTEERQTAGKQDERSRLWNLLLHRCVRDAEARIAVFLIWKKVEHDEGENTVARRPGQQRRVFARHSIDLPQEVKWKAAENEGNRVRVTGHKFGPVDAGAPVTGVDFLDHGVVEEQIELPGLQVGCA